MFATIVFLIVSFKSKTYMLYYFEVWQGTIILNLMFYTL